MKVIKRIKRKNINLHTKSATSNDRSEKRGYTQEQIRPTHLGTKARIKRSLEMKTDNIVELKIAQCALPCKDCRSVYTNDVLSFRIICSCKCHKNCLMIRPKVSLEQIYNNTEFLDGNSGTNELLTSVIDELHTKAENKIGSKTWEKWNLII